MHDRRTTLDTVAVAALVSLWAETFTSLPSLPATVATSFAFDGAAQRYGSKYLLLLLPAIAVLAYLLVDFTIRTKMRMNLPFRVPEERIGDIMPVCDYFQRVARVEVLTGFVAVQWVLIESAREVQLVGEFMPFVLTLVAVIVATTVLFMLRIWRIAHDDAPPG